VLSSRAAKLLEPEVWITSQRVVGLCSDVNYPGARASFHAVLALMAASNVLSAKALQAQVSSKLGMFYFSVGAT
jgi:hypothetical protein